ncbi:MAG: hypothetical protein E7375_02760 [Clostridiales bacterium]|nr:hypothetical protein [Clostridiales bacterium]
MARFNCCRFNHPCPICCPCIRCCENTVINPVITSIFGFFNNLSAGTIADDAIIPLNFVEGDSANIATSPTVPGAVFLAAGTYQVTYLAGGTVPAGGTLAIALRLNGIVIEGSTLMASQTVGDVVNLSQTISITVAQGSTLELINVSGEATTYSYASMFVRVIE